MAGLWSKARLPEQGTVWTLEYQKERELWSRKENCKVEFVADKVTEEVTLRHDAGQSGDKNVEKVPCRVYQAYSALLRGGAADSEVPGFSDWRILWTRLAHWGGHVGQCAQLSPPNLCRVPSHAQPHGLGGEHLHLHLPPHPQPGHLHDSGLDIGHPLVRNGYAREDWTSNSLFVILFSFVSFDN